MRIQHAGSDVLLIVVTNVIHRTGTLAKGCFADFNTSLYFSMITHANRGYGEAVLDDEQWLLTGVEAVTSSLMLCSLRPRIMAGRLARALLLPNSSPPPKSTD